MEENMSISKKSKTSILDDTLLAAKSILKLFDQTVAFVVQLPIFAPLFAQVAESVDALVSNTSGATRAGSIPALGTWKHQQKFCWCFFISSCIGKASLKYFPYYI